MKSHEQDLLTVCECILLDARAKCSITNVSIMRDLNKIRSRVKHEGISFLTITLPSFGQEFERSLESMEATSCSFPGWKKSKCLPAFLQGFTRLVFDAETGRLLDEPDIGAIEGIRQIAYSFKKLKLPCGPGRVDKALSGFKEVECILQESMPSSDVHLFNEVSRLLWGNVFAGEFDPQQLIPKHGPGQTGEHITGNQKYSHRVWYERLEPFFPSDAFIMSCVSQFTDDAEGLDSVQFVPSEHELPVRITPVPKTLKGPRIIAIEPVCMQYAQQALARHIIGKLKVHDITAGHINFDDQSVNRKLAMTASSDRLYATLDLSDASDRVPLSLVSSMLDVYPDLRDAILACRSKAAQMPDGEIIHLRKFASMGSALCFPIEAMVFFTGIIVSILKSKNLPVTLRNMYNISRSVYVYGDDIIIPIDWVDIVLETLASFYCKVNVRKSFWKGYFRESCGMDAYAGYDVTPTYLRSMPPKNKGSISGLLSWIATSNLFYLRGYWRTADLLKNRVESLKGTLPIVLKNSPGVGWLSFQRGHSVHRWNTKLHRPEVSTYVASTVYRKDALEGYSALLKCFLSLELAEDSSSASSFDSKHLTRSPRSGTSSMKRRWTVPY